MTNEEILKKAIEKAVENGWRLDPASKTYMFFIAKRPEQQTIHKDFIRGVLFSHDFAKAFWGEEWGYRYAGYKVPNEKEVHTKNLCSWQFHLQQMVLSKEPLLYLEKFLE